MKMAFELDKTSEDSRILDEFQRTFEIDKKLFKADVVISIAYSDSLFDAGVLTRNEAERIKNGLRTFLKRVDFDKDYFKNSSAKNVHRFIEEKLVKLVGEVGTKIQIGRSFYDQSSTTLRFWLREEIVSISKKIREIQRELINLTEANFNAVFISRNHSQKAEAILFPHWCLAYFEMFRRDRERLDEVWRRTNIMPLGSNVSAGTSLEIDREELARKLEFEGISANSIDAVSDRDFTIEFVNATALISLHILRLVEDFSQYSSENAEYLIFGEKIKRTDLEMIRGKLGVIFGHQTNLNFNLKSLPTAYSQDFTEHNKPIFEASEVLQMCLQIIHLILKDLSLNEENINSALSTGYLNSSELVDYLVQRGVSIKSAKEISKKIVDYSKPHEKEIHTLQLVELQKFSSVIEEDIFDQINPNTILESKNQIGGTAPERITEALEEAKRSLQFEE